MGIRRKTLLWVEFVLQTLHSSPRDAGCACPRPCDETDEIGKVACPSGKHLKEGREEKTGISLELPWQAGTQRETEAQESALLGWGGTGQLERVDAELSPALSSRAAGEGGIRRQQV